MTVLLGRHMECAELDRLVADVSVGVSRVLALRGEAGSGKSALLGYLAERMAGWRVVSVVSVESETELLYSGLHQLCEPLLDGLAELPAPQRDALATAFGLAVGPVPGPFLVGLAALKLMAQVAQGRPLACLVDNGQWLDRASAQVLAFVARRLTTERVALVCAARSRAGDDALAGMPELAVGALSDSDARLLLLSNVPGPLDAAVVNQIIAESHGNPLALLELPRGWTPTELAGGFGLPGCGPVRGAIERSYAQRLLLLPADTQLLVRTAAAEPLGDPVLLRRAAAALEIGLSAAVPAADAGLLQIRGRVEFTHLLARSAAYRTASPDDRQRVHRALADAIDAGRNPDWRAWHRALAAATADEEVAAELEHSAARAQARAGLTAAAAFLTRAVELTPLPVARTRRALAAASAHTEAAAFNNALALLDLAEGGPTDELQRAQIDLLRAEIAFASRFGNEATPLLLAAARRLQPLAPRLARQAYLDAFSAAHVAARFGGAVGPAEVAREVRSAPRPPAEELTPGDLLLRAFAALASDYAAGVPPGQEAVNRLRRDPDAARGNPRWLWQGCVLALELWDDEAADVLSEHYLRLVQDVGALSELPLAFSLRTPVLVFLGELAAAAVVEEKSAALKAGGIGAAWSGALILAAWRGQVPEARTLIGSTARQATARGAGIGVAVSEYSHAVACNSLGQSAEAFAAVRAACADPAEMLVRNWAMPELVEAAARGGGTELAAATAARLSARARACGSNWALGIAACSRALVSDGDGAEDSFRAAVEYLSRTRARGALARAHLLYGEWLRQRNRRAAARRELTQSHEMFTAMGMDGFAERARRELVAAGTAFGEGTAEAVDRLTEQEALIARLARDGRSNPEIGAQLFLSARTVEWHLRKVYSKLGISSRRQLRRALDA